MTLSHEHYLELLRGSDQTGSDLTLAMALQSCLTCPSIRDSRPFHTSEEEEIIEPTYRMPLRQAKYLLRDEELPL